METSISGPCSVVLEYSINISQYLLVGVQTTTTHIEYCFFLLLLYECKILQNHVKWVSEHFSKLCKFKMFHNVESVVHKKRKQIMNHQSPLPVRVQSLRVEDVPGVLRLDSRNRLSLHVHRAGADPGPVLPSQVAQELRVPVSGNIALIKPGCLTGCGQGNITS